MKIFVAVIALAAFACAELAQEEPVSGNFAYGYLKNYAIPQAERIRKAEETYMSQSRIIGGLPTSPGQYPYQAGLLISLIGTEGTGICGASLISDNRLLTAAHCWFDGMNQAWKLTVVLGSTLLFYGGTRIDTSVVAMHPEWTPYLIRNDIAVIYLPSAVQISAFIAPVALPSNADMNDNFVGQSGIATGFGLTVAGGSISLQQELSQVRLSIISNTVCSYASPLFLQPSNICTSGVGGVGTCHGDSGGPLVVDRNDGRRILVGVTSYGSIFGCDSVMPAVFARVTSFMPFITQHL